MNMGKKFKKTAGLLMLAAVMLLAACSGGGSGEKAEQNDVSRDGESPDTVQSNKLFRCRFNIYRKIHVRQLPGNHRAANLRTKAR